jgi:hypothetical protein
LLVVLGLPSSLLVLLLVSLLGYYFAEIDSLCSKCRFMFENEGVKRDDYKLDERGKKCYSHHNDIGDLVLASEQGCRCCQLLWERLYLIERMSPYAVQSTVGFPNDNFLSTTIFTTTQS